MVCVSETLTQNPLSTEQYSIAVSPEKGEFDTFIELNNCCIGLLVTWDSGEILFLVVILGFHFY